MTPTVEAALFYFARGWVPVRVEVRGKMPTAGKGWQTIRPTADDVRRWGECNVGVLLGSASGGLVDVDLDCAEAAELAPFYLPATWVFGRPSKPRSHWVYVVTEGWRTWQLHDDVADADGKFPMLLEARGDTSTGQPGCQTVMPPSIHATGEPITWDADIGDALEAPCTLTRGELGQVVGRLALATLARRRGMTVDEARAYAAAWVPPPPEPPKRPSLANDRERTTGDVELRARRYVAAMPPSISGSGGHGALWAAACALVVGFQLDDGTALRILADDFNPRCDPLWRTNDLERKCREARAKSDRVPGYLLDDEKRRA